MPEQVCATPGLGNLDRGVVQRDARHELQPPAPERERELPADVIPRVRRLQGRTAATTSVESVDRNLRDRELRLYRRR